MKAPKRRRPLVRTIDPQPSPDLADLAGVVKYVGSPEHKDSPSFAGQPRPRADASICDRRLSRKQHQLNRWLRTAIARGAVSEHREGGFPRYVWYKDGDVVFEGRLVNRDAGWYKGYPLSDRGEWPEGIESLYG
jgi:hypothetical protein